MSEIVTQSEQTEQPIVRYAVTDKAIAELREKYRDRKADSTEGYALVRGGIAEIRTLRVDVEKRRKELKESSLAWGRKVDTEAKRITAMLVEIETPLIAAKFIVDEEKERAKKAKEDAERARIAAELQAIRDAEEAKRKAQQEAEWTRIKAEQEAAAVALVEERKKFREEQERLAKEHSEREAIRKDEQAKIDAENYRIASDIATATARMNAEKAKVEAEQKAERDRLAAERVRLERIEFERIARERAEKQAAEKVERERVAAELDAQRERERLARLAESQPDREKLRAFGAQIRGLALPTVTTDMAKRVLDTAWSRIMESVEYLEQFGEEEERG